MFVTCGITATVNMFQTKSVWSFKFKDMDVYGLLSEKPPPKNIYYPSENHIMWQNCNNKLDISKRLHNSSVNSFRYSVKGTIHPSHFAPWHRRRLLFNWASVQGTRIKASREDNTRRRGGGKVGAADLWSARHCQGTTDYKKTGDEEESGRCQSGSLSAGDGVLKVDERGAFVQTL